MSAQVNSLDAFVDASDLFDQELVLVSRLNSANSVWKCEFKNSQPLIFKYFPKTDHGRIHFEIERTIYDNNKTNATIPDLIFADSQRNLLVTPYLQQQAASPVQFGQLLADAPPVGAGVEYRASPHEHLPGIIGTWKSKTGALSTAQTIILEFARNSTTISQRITRFSSSWTNDCLIHGDLKLANILFVGNSFVVIDWESLTLGPLVWDHAAILQSILLEVISGGTRERWCRHQLEALEKLLTSADDLLLDAVTARCVQSSLETCHLSTKVPRVAATMLQVADFVSIRNFDFFGEL